MTKQPDTDHNSKVTHNVVRKGAAIVAPKVDGRQSETAAAVQRGVARVLGAYGFCTLYEVVLANGRRADVVGLGRKGEIWIIEIKSSVEDFRTDTKWQDYREYCDSFYFAVQTSFPVDLIPQDTGLILADRYGGEIARKGSEHSMAAARRKAMLISIGRQAAGRLSSLIDPGLHQIINESSEDDTAR